MGHLTYSVTSPQLQIEGSSHDNARVGPEVVLLTPTNLVNPQVPSLVTRAPRFVGEMNAEEVGAYDLRAEHTGIPGDDYVLVPPEPQETPPDTPVELQEGFSRRLFWNIL